MAGGLAGLSLLVVTALWTADRGCRSCWPEQRPGSPRSAGWPAWSAPT
ncbi:hypothetical protein V2I01_02280 [Micromonospora sp. BRA006-A]|nr:hypothetical protein [Micromonospora sp. BRA006-A]